MSKVLAHLLLLAFNAFQVSQSTSIFGKSRIGYGKFLLPIGGGVKGPGDIDLGPVTDFTCPNGETISANPNDCSQYYTCYLGSPVNLWQCVSDYLFDLSYYGCNFPQNVNCGDRPKPDGSATSTSSATSSTTVSTTPPTTYSSTSSVSTVSPSSTTTGNPVPGDFQCPFPDGYFPVPGACSSDYYDCQAGVPTSKTCTTNGYVFDPVTLRCTNAADATCNTFQCPDENAGFFPITPDACCQTFFVCVSGVATLEKCPGTTFFDPNILNCLVNAPCLGVKNEN